MGRLTLLDLDQLSPEQQSVADAIRANADRKGRLPLPYHAALYNPDLVDAWQRMGGLLRYGSRVPTDLNELAVLVTARHWECSYIWKAHAPVAAAAGVTPALIEAVRLGQELPATRDEELAIVRFSREVHEERKVSKDTYDRVYAILGTNGLVDLTALLGYYAMVAMMLNTHELSADDGTLLPHRRFGLLPVSCTAG